MDAALVLTVAQVAVLLMPAIFSIVFASKAQPFFARYAQVVFLSLACGLPMVFLISPIFATYFTPDYLSKQTSEVSVQLITSALFLPFLMIPWINRQRRKKAAIVRD